MIEQSRGASEPAGEKRPEPGQDITRDPAQPANDKQPLSDADAIAELGDELGGPA